MTKAAQVTAILFGALALGCIITSLVTSNWTKACVGVDKIMDAFSGNTGLFSSGFDLTSGLFSGNDVCYEEGLFKISFSLAPIFSVNFPIGIGSLSNLTKVVGGLLVGGSFFFLIGIILVAAGALSESENKSSKSSAANKHSIGVAMLTLGTICLLAGSAVYTQEQVKTLHNPGKVFSHLGNVLQRSFSHFDGSIPSSPSLLSDFDFGSLNTDQNERKKRQSKTENENDEGIDSYMHSYMSSPDFASFPGNFGDMSDQFKSILKSLDASFDYSFFLVWTGCGLALLATIIGALACCKMPKEDHNEKKYTAFA